MFVRAIEKAAALCPDICGLMVGDGPLRPQAEQLARAASARIRFSGFLNQSEMAAAYAAADALVVPSEWETWGLVVNEAMACGVTAIVTDGVACAHDLVVSGQTGEVVRVASLDDLVDRLLRLARDGGRRTELAANARRHVAHFDVGVAVDGTLRAMDAVGRRGAAARLTVVAEPEQQA